ncbi:type II toxin-antitoxin system VapC family toxin [Tersicoccus phoenicis]|nr:type II toxin-antitoxin system VapC family toxin [Tersicoccus phoenicis]
MTYLLDTHVVLWLLGDPDRVPEHWRRTLADRESTVVVSAISALEVATKERLRKLEVPGLVAGWEAHLTASGMTSLSVSARHALAAGKLVWEHRDPFDRVLVAQARCEGHTLVTVDRTITAREDIATATW